jgi:signal transduction histidine kinase
MENIKAIQTSRLMARLVAISPVEDCPQCFEVASGLKISLFEDYLDLLSMEHLDLILELTGSETILSEIISQKRPTVGILDHHASMLLLDVAHIHLQEAQSDPGITIARSFASALLEASPDDVFIIDKSYKILDFNNPALFANAADKSAILGKRCYKVIDGAPCQCSETRTSCPAAEAQRTGKPARMVNETTGSDGTVQVRNITAYPIFDSSGRFAQVVITIRDMTKELGDRVEQRARALKKSLSRIAEEDRLSSLGRLVASVCHEINNPITSIVTFTRLVQSIVRERRFTDEMMSQVEQYLDLSFHEAMRCGSIVKNLLTFARPKGLESREINLAEVVDTVIRLTSHQFKVSHIDCDIGLPSPPLTVYADFAKLQQCLLNLVFNAIDAMPEGGNIRITGGFDQAAESVWLEVSDTGHGIEPGDKGRIFEPFYSTKPDGKGVGLGLSMVYGIIREHHGNVEVDSEPGKGATFRLVLPVNGKADIEHQSVPNTVFSAEHPACQSN